jgi:hypothetical protein
MYICISNRRQREGDEERGNISEHERPRRLPFLGPVVAKQEQKKRVRWGGGCGALKYKYFIFIYNPHKSG